MAKKKGNKSSDFECKKCDKSYKTKSGFDKHNKKFHEFPCDVCGKTYKTESGRDSHIVSEHRKTTESPVPKAKSEPDLFVCPFNDCGETFTTKQLALDHIEKSHRPGSKVAESPKSKSAGVVKSVDSKPEPEPEPEPEVDYNIHRITRVVPPVPTKSYGRADFMFKGRRRERG